METNNKNSKAYSVLKAVGKGSSPDREFLAGLRERSAVEFAAAPASQNASESKWRVFMTSRLFKVAAMVAVVAIVAIVGVKFAGGTDAYAQIVQELKVARTIVFTLVRQANDGSGKTINVDVAYKEPGHMRTSTVDGYIAILDAGSDKMISIVPQGGYTIGETSSFTKTGNLGPFAGIEAMRTLPAKADENLGTKEIDGIEAEGFSVKQGDATTIVWIETKSGDLVQVEHKFASAPGMNTIMKNVKLDIPLEDSLFSLTPPAGYKEFGSGMLKSQASDETEETFVKWLGWWAGGNVDDAFPPMVAGAEIAKACMDMGKQGKLKKEVWEHADTGKMYSALIFVAKLPEGSWRYAGNGVKINTPDKAIFWYKPAGKELYRVIYADLTIREMPEDQLPK